MQQVRIYQVFFIIEAVLCVVRLIESVVQANFSAATYIQFDEFGARLDKM
jgi:hypothetical protein